MTTAAFGLPAMDDTPASSDRTDSEPPCAVGTEMARRLRDARVELTARWLERIAARVALDPNKVFPTDELLDHVPILLEGIAGYLENPANEVSAETPVIAKARELGKLRHAQGFDAYEIMKEYEILGGILFSFLAITVDDVNVECGKGELMTCGRRLFRAIAVIQQATTVHFLQLADEKVAEREGRLRAFNRTVSHEIKNRIGTILGASENLREDTNASVETRNRFLAMISRNARELSGTVENLLVLSRMEEDVRQHRNVLLVEAAREAVRQLRDMADAAGVDVRLAADMPEVEANAGAVELCLTNYISNAIKYMNPAEPARFVEISARISENAAHEREIVVRAADNGIGVPVEMRESLFQQFYRAHEVTSALVAGTGLGLSIVRDTVESIGGHAWAEFPERGSVFAFSLPCRREEAPESTDQGSDAIGSSGGR